MTDAPFNPDRGKPLRDVEREHILEMLRRCRGFRDQAASALQISLRTLYNKLNRYELDGVDVPPSPRRRRDGANRN